MFVDRRALLRSIIVGVIPTAAPRRLVAAPVNARAWIAPPAMPAGPAGEQLGWILTAINDGARNLAETDLADRFTTEFLTALPAPDLLGIIRTYFVPNGPFELARVEGAPSDHRIKAIMTTPGRDWRVTIGVAGAAQINALFFEPVYQPPPLEKPLTNWKSLKPRLARIAPLDSYLAAEIVDGELEWIHSLNANSSLGVGSSFKLYVLGELARQITSGTLSWDEPLAISDNLRSLPNGSMRLEPAGATYPILHFAEQMVSASDNTATDHLIARLGRENVESAFSAFGNRRPERNIPLLLTREWFAIKLRLSPEEIDRFLAAEIEGKRSWLAGKVDREALTLTEEEQWPGSYYIEAIEWFASAADLCRVMTALHLQAADPLLSPVHDALSINPGIAFDARTWAYVGYKGGYETGVKSDVWLLQRRDGRWFVVAAIINDEKKEIDGVRLWQHVMPAVDLLARHD